MNCLLGDAHGARQSDLRHVMGVKAGNVSFVGVGHDFLGLDHLQVVYHARREAVLRLSQSLIGQIQRTLRHRNLIRSRLKVHERGTDLVVNAAAQVLEF